MARFRRSHIPSLRSTASSPTSTASPAPASSRSIRSCGTAGRRTHVLTILFALQQIPAGGAWRLVIDLVDTHPQGPPLLKVTVNDHAAKFALPRGGSDASVTGQTASSREHIIELPIPPGTIRPGGNEIRLAILDGSWMVFDQLRLEGPAGVVQTPIHDLFIRDVRPAGYHIAADGQLAWRFRAAPRDACTAGSSRATRFSPTM